MIRGYTLESAEMVRQVLTGLRKPKLPASEIADIALQCAESEAMCLACEDGMLVLQLRAAQDHLELFILAAVAFRHGAVERQDAALLTIARDLEAKTIAFQSRRAGWGRRLGPEWTRRGLDEFVRDVDSGRWRTG